MFSYHETLFLVLMPLIVIGLLLLPIITKGIYTLAPLFVIPIIFCSYDWVSIDKYQVLSEGKRLNIRMHKHFTSVKHLVAT